MVMAVVVAVWLRVGLLVRSMVMVVVVAVWLRVGVHIALFFLVAK